MGSKHRNIFILLFLLLNLNLHSQSVGLVLSGGGAKGISHIGIIKALEENNIPIDYVAGTSIGAIVGGLYSIGLTPDEMIYLLKSPEFQKWYTGVPEEDFAWHMAKGRTSPSMATLKLGRKINKDGKPGEITVGIGSSLVSPYPMDLAVVQIFASSSAASNYDFDKLMVPFFCVSGDIVNKVPFITDKGDLGSAIRASMTFPGYFKPITIDSTLLFDGGIYNNFPWDIMKEKFNPDFIIGGKCSSGEAINPTENNPFKQIEALIMVDTDYNIPEDEGVVIDGDYDLSLMDFTKIDETVKMGYDNAMKLIPQIKAKVRREVTPDDRMALRLNFRQKCSELRFDEVRVDAEGLNNKQREYIRRVMRRGNDTLKFSDIKRGYYRLVATNTLSNLFPMARMNEDSLYTLTLKASPTNHINLDVGGNISSSSLNQGYFGFSYDHLSKYPWKADLGFDIGQYYTGATAYWGQDMSTKTPLYYEIMVNVHRFDYFTSAQRFLVSSSINSYIQENELYLTMNMGMPLSMRKNILVELGVTLGKNTYNYYDVTTFSKYDTPDNTELFYVSPRVLINKETFDYRLYPTNGVHSTFELRYVRSGENHTPGSLSPEGMTLRNSVDNNYMVKFYRESYNNLTKWFSLGYTLDISLSHKMELGDYYSNLLMCSGFQPTPHSKTVLLDNYRAYTYAGVALSPIFKFSPTIYLHTTAAYFQPYEQIQPLENGEYTFSKPFPIGSFMASAAMVWQSPIGPVSLSCAYYDKAETRWYPQLNIGFLLTRKRGLRN